MDFCGVRRGWKGVSVFARFSQGLGGGRLFLFEGDLFSGDLLFRGDMGGIGVGISVCLGIDGGRGRLVSLCGGVLTGGSLFFNLLIGFFMYRDYCGVLLLRCHERVDGSAGVGSLGVGINRIGEMYGCCGCAVSSSVLRGVFDDRDGGGGVSVGGVHSFVIRSLGRGMVSRIVGHGTRLGTTVSIFLSTLG